MLFRTPYDYVGRHMLRAALAGHGTVESEAEVPAEARKIDLWFMPDATCPPLPAYLGLLGQLLAAPATVELCHNTPTAAELAEYIIKHGQFRRYLAARAPPPPVPTQWVICSGRPDSGIADLQFQRLPNGPPGLYTTVPLLWTRLVVVSELLPEPDTLLLRLLGKGLVFRNAVGELRALPDDAPERRLALPILLRYRATIPADPMQRTKDDQEFSMDTDDIVETWRQQIERTGFDKGERATLLRQLRRRFGPLVDAPTEQRVTTAPAEQVETWLDRVLTAGTLADVFAG